MNIFEEAIQTRRKFHSRPEEAGLSLKLRIW